VRLETFVSSWGSVCSGELDQEHDAEHCRRIGGTIDQMTFRYERTARIQARIYPDLKSAIDISVSVIGVRMAWSE